MFYETYATVQCVVGGKRLVIGTLLHAPGDDHSGAVGRALPAMGKAHGVCHQRSAHRCGSVQQARGHQDRLPAGGGHAGRTRTRGHGPRVMCMALTMMRFNAWIVAGALHKLEREGPAPATKLHSALSMMVAVLDTDPALTRAAPAGPSGAGTPRVHVIPTVPAPCMQGLTSPAARPMPAERGAPGSARRAVSRATYPRSRSRDGRAAPGSALHQARGRIGRTLQGAAGRRRARSVRSLDGSVDAVRVSAAARANAQRRVQVGCRRLALHPAFRLVGGHHHARARRVPAQYASVPPKIRPAARKATGETQDPTGLWPRRLQVLPGRRRPETPRPTVSRRP